MADEQQKTPEYTREAIARYRQKTKQKTVNFNLETEEAELLEKAENNPAGFSGLVKQLLRDHFDK